MKILLTGGTGFIGSHLARKLEADGHELVRVSRGPQGDVDWSIDRLGPAVASCDAVVHLAGENLFGKRWSERQKSALRSSRIETTRKLAELAATQGVRRFVCASAVGYYGPSDEVGLDESSPAGHDFLARLCVDWEAAADVAREAGVSTACVRTGVVLGRDGGALARMLPPFRMGLGGPLGSGKQWVSWIEVEDLASLFAFLVRKPELEGAFNGTAPNPVTMSELAHVLGRVLGRPVLLPVPAFVLKAALGEAANVLLTGQHVLPSRALQAGFEFASPELEGALGRALGRSEATLGR